MTTKPQTLLPLPDPPEREPDDMTSFQHLTKNGGVHHLIQYLGNPDTTIVEGEGYIIPEPGAPASDRLVPDLLIALGREPGHLPRGQRLCPVPSRETSRLRNGDSLAQHRPAGRGSEGPQVR